MRNDNFTHANNSTLGEKVDDIFYLITPDGNAITDRVILDTLESNPVAALEARKVV